MRTEFDNSIMAYRTTCIVDPHLQREVYQVIHTHPFMAVEQTIWNFPLAEWDMRIIFTRKEESE
jgi:hypothetical protein